MHANQREDIKACYAGDIVAAVGLKMVRTGDTLCDSDHKILLEKIDFPEPVIRIAIEPKTKADQDRLSGALTRLETEDPSFTVSVDSETGQTLIAGMGELHLEIIIDRLQREFNVVANVGKPQVAYRETVGKVADAEGKFIRQGSGKAQYAHCWLRVSPGASGSGFQFKDSTSTDLLLAEFISAIHAGAEAAFTTGVLAGYPMVDVSVEVFDGSYHEQDSSEMAFRIAGSMAFRAACESASPILLEPVMEVEIVVPEEHVGDVIGDANGRRGEVKKMEPRRRASVVTAEVPLARMVGYSTDLRSATQGRGTYSMKFARYAPVPQSVAQTIVGGFSA